MTETGSRILLGVAAVLAGTTVLMGVFGLVYNPVLLLAAVPFAAATYFLWSSATGRLDAQMRDRVETRRVGSGGDADGATTGRGGGSDGAPGPGDVRQRPPDPGDRRGPRSPGSDGRNASAGRRTPGPRQEATRSRSAAASVLGVDPAADEAEIRRAFREKARELHPDAPGGDEVAFRRVRTAYERLTESR